jgi:hypothetical protein
MPRARPIDDILADAEQIERVWADNSTFVLNDVTLQQFQTMITGLRTQHGKTENLRTQLTAEAIETNNRALAVNGTVTRVRSGIRGFYGPNSAQYGQVGGTRTSERKRPTRKKKLGGSNT